MYWEFLLWGPPLVGLVSLLLDKIDFPRLLIVAYLSLLATIIFATRSCHNLVGFACIYFIFFLFFLLLFEQLYLLT
jgi:hypothetical protein